MARKKHEELRELLNNKNFFGVEEFIETLDLEENLKNLFGLLGSFETKEEEIAEAKKLAASYPVILSAITDLETLGEYLKTYGIEKYISLSLELSAIINIIPELSFMAIHSEPVSRLSKVAGMTAVGFLWQGRSFNRICNCCGSASCSISAVRRSDLPLLRLSCSYCILRRLHTMHQ